MQSLRVWLSMSCNAAGEHCDPHRCAPAAQRATCFAELPACSVWKACCVRVGLQGHGSRQRRQPAYGAAARWPPRARRGRTRRWPRQAQHRSRRLGLHRRWPLWQKGWLAPSGLQQVRTWVLTCACPDAMCISYMTCTCKCWGCYLPNAQSLTAMVVPQVQSGLQMVRQACASTDCKALPWSTEHAGLKRMQVRHCAPPATVVSNLMRHTAPLAAWRPACMPSLGPKGGAEERLDISGAVL